jgi:hypothetical protein
MLCWGLCVKRRVWAMRGILTICWRRVLGPICKLWTYFCRGATCSADKAAECRSQKMTYLAEPWVRRFYLVNSISFSVPETILLFKSIFKTGWIQIQDWTSIDGMSRKTQADPEWMRGIRNYNTLIAWSSIHLDHSSINWLDIASLGAKAIWLPGDNLLLWQLPAMKWWYSELIALTSSHPKGRSYAYIYVVRGDH